MRLSNFILTLLPLLIAAVNAVNVHHAIHIHRDLSPNLNTLSRRCARRPTVPVSIISFAFFVICSHLTRMSLLVLPWPPLPLHLLPPRIQHPRHQLPRLAVQAHMGTFSFFLSFALHPYSPIFTVLPEAVVPLVRPVSVSFFQPHSPYFQHQQAKSPQHRVPTAPLAG